MQVGRGGTVLGSDLRRASHVDRVLVDPRSWEVTHVIVRTGGRGQASRKLVPMSLVERWGRGGVVLRLTGEELRRMPDYLQRDYVVPRGLLASTGPVRRGNLPVPLMFTQPGFPYGPGIVPRPTAPMDQPIAGPVPWHEPPSGTIAIGAHAVAEAVDGEIGTIERLLLDTYTNRVSAFVVAARRTIGRDLVVPLEWVAFVAPDRVRFAATRQQLEHLIGVPAGNFLSAVGPGGRVRLMRAASRRVAA